MVISNLKVQIQKQRKNSIFSKFLSLFSFPVYIPIVKQVYFFKEKDEFDNIYGKFLEYGITDVWSYNLAKEGYFSLLLK